MILYARVADIRTKVGIRWYRGYRANGSTLGNDGKQKNTDGEHF